jgi:two-component system KDP operon response regulator KdpE
MKIVIIEDDPRITDILSINLRVRWPKVVIITTKNGLEGIEMAAKEEPSLIILDLGLPDIDGLDVLKQIRDFSDIPVLILSVRGDEADVVEGLELGADEYITKPFRQMELLSRIQCILRRQHGETDSKPLTSGILNYLPAKRRLIFGDKEMVLTATEARIFEELIKNDGRAVTTGALAQSIWGDDYPGSAEAIHVYIRRLRQKVESDPSRPQIIINLPGIGYSLQVPG